MEYTNPDSNKATRTIFISIAFFKKGSADPV